MVIAVYIFTGIAGAILPYFLTRSGITNAVKASAFPSLVLALIFYFIPNLMGEFFQKNIPVLFFGASFVGMVSAKILPRYSQVAACGVLFALLYKNASEFFNGFGGGLGTSACIAVICVFTFKKLNELRRKRK